MGYNWQKDTRLEIIVHADTMIRNKGFNAFSYSDISTIMDIRNAAIHYYFPTKSSLGRAVMQEEMLRLTSFRRRHALAAIGGEDQLKHLVAAFYYNARAHAICLMGALTPEFATFDEEMQETVRRLCTAIQEWVADCLDEARTAGKLRFEGTAADRAALVISALLASLLLSRIEGTELFERMLDRMLEDLGANWRVGQLERPEPGTHIYYSFT